MKNCKQQTGTPGEISPAVVVGGVNIDIGGRPWDPLVMHDSNPGRIHTSLGGVGRNIAHNMSLLGMRVQLLTAFGEDIYAARIEESCRSLGIDISRALRVPGADTSMYLYISDERGNMELAVSDMKLSCEITPAYLEANRDVLDAAQLIAADANIPEDSLAFLAGNGSVPVFVDPVSVAKAGKVKPYLGRIHTLKPNRAEAELLSGIKIRDEESLKMAAEKLLSTGLERVFISLGADGVLAADHREFIRADCCPAQVKNTTGAGDAFLAALAWAWEKKLDLRHTVDAARAAAAIASEGADTINPMLTEAAVLDRLQH